jgi:hypothetical protein
MLGTNPDWNIWLKYILQSPVHPWKGYSPYSPFHSPFFESPFLRMNEKKSDSGFRNNFLYGIFH